jgi:hypothetical protein
LPFSEWALRLRWRGDGEVPLPMILASDTAADEIDGLTDLLAE